MQLENFPDSFFLQLINDVVKDVIETSLSTRYTCNCHTCCVVQGIFY